MLVFTLSQLKKAFSPFHKQALVSMLWRRLKATLEKSGKNGEETTHNFMLFVRNPVKLC